jgi:flagellar biosynthesis protein FlhF
MRLKSYTAKTMTEAMKMVREDLGEDAIIIATREENAGKTVRVTAAVERDRAVPGAMESDEFSDDNWLYADDDDAATVVEEITETMLRHGAPEDVLDQVVSCVSVMGLEEPRIALLAALENLFSFKPLPAGAMGRPLMLVGMPGSGKTLAAAKLAARASLQGLNVQVITTDSQRAGGFEQLSAFTRLMEIDLKKAGSIPEFLARLEETKGADQVLIDTAGVNPFDMDQVKALARLIGAADVMPVLVHPAGGDADETGDIAKVFATIGAHSLLATRVDVARRLGGLLAAAHQGGLSFAEVSDTARVADGLSPMTPSRLTQLLLPRAEDMRVHNARKAG